MFSKRLFALWCLVLASAIVPLPARAQSTELAGTGAVEYRLVHKFHKFTGRSKAMVVRGAVDAGGLKAMARAQVGTFDSDNTNRDEHMMETVEGTKYPWVTVRVAAMGYKLPTSPSTAKLVVQGAVELHGVTVNHPIELGVETQDGVHFRVHFEFVESLTAHKIERPSLLFMPVDDTITIVGSAEITAKR